MSGFGVIRRQSIGKGR
uniref:Uncharacterized protein n=1 Tax=Rhizophora mucronata TaxID=61149 RepID=A0A2P2Q1M6_RHIMU